MMCCLLTQGVMATDLKGLGLLKQEGVFECHQTWLENQRQAEYSASEVMLRSGYNLGSLMTRYQGVNWLDTSKWDCNARLDPTQDGLYDGTSVNPLEVSKPIGRASQPREEHRPRA